MEQVKVQRTTHGASASTATPLLDEIIEQTSAARVEESKPLVRQGVRELMRQLLQTPGNKRVDRAAVDAAIAAIDRKLSQQTDRILHDARFQQLESAWRGLKFLVDRTDFRQNIRISLLQASKRELQEDFKNRPEIAKSGLYRHAYTAEYGTHGGRPYGAIIGNYDFGPGAQDMSTLRSIAAVSAMAHAPFIAAAGPSFFGVKSFQELPALKDLKASFESVQYTAWRGFRDSEDARYVGLTTPRFLLRRPYGRENAARTFHYEETAREHEQYLWGNTAFAFATRLTESFGKYRWCANIIGPRGGGQVHDLPVALFRSQRGDLAMKIPTEALISERREFELAEEGFIALTMRKDADNACFFSANSAQRPKTFGASPEGRAAETNSRLGAQLPYVFIVSRLAHYIKLIQRENIGSDRERGELERELNSWIKQYVTEDDNPMSGVRARCPLRQAEIKVDDVEGQPGWYKVGIKVRPQFKYMGAFFTLSLVGKLDKDKR